MDFESVLGRILQEFEQRQIRYGVIGGFALAALGVPRTTMDLDFLVHRQEYYELFELGEEARQLRARYGKHA